MSDSTPENAPRPTPGPPVPAAPASTPRPAPSSAGDAAQHVTDPAAAPDLGEHSTGDIVIDSALQDLRDAPTDDLDAQLEAGRRVHQTLQGRLSHLGGE